MGGVYYIAMEIAEGSVHSVQSVGPAKRFKWKAIEDNNTEGEERGRGADSFGIAVVTPHKK